MRSRANQTTLVDIRLLTGVSGSKNCWGWRAKEGNRSNIFMPSPDPSCSSCFVEGLSLSSLQPRPGLTFHLHRSTEGPSVVAEDSQRTAARVKLVRTMIRCDLVRVVMAPRCRPEARCPRRKLCRDYKCGGERSGFSTNRFSTTSQRPLVHCGTSLSLHPGRLRVTCPVSH